MYQLSFSLNEFLTKYWQKKPTIIKGGFANFLDPISPEELAGLCMEEEIDSRYISNLNNDWQAEHGPFDEEKFTSLGETNWSFIVQAVNHWHVNAAELVKPFKALPQWLFDDLMISYSVKGGGVGPHIDQYDVFIIQGKGKRHWRVGNKDHGQYTEIYKAGALRQIESFEPIIDQVIEPGDILYIPPGFPHDGYALEPSMSYSVGFRSPKEQELLSNFADYVLAHDLGDTHMHKPDLNPQTAHGEISRSDLSTLTDMLTNALSDETQLNAFMGSMLSQSRHQLDIVLPESPFTTDEIADHLNSGYPLIKVAGLRSLYNQEKPGELFINGETFELPNEELLFASLLCNQESVALKDLNNGLSNVMVKMMQTLVNKGYWYPVS